MVIVFFLLQCHSVAAITQVMLMVLLCFKSDSLCALAKFTSGAIRLIVEYIVTAKRNILHVL